MKQKYYAKAMMRQRQRGCKEARKLARNRKRFLQSARKAGKLSGRRPDKAELSWLRVIRGGLQNREESAKIRRSCPARNSEWSVRVLIKCCLEIGTLITAIGAGIGNADMDVKVKYHKIVIMTDAMWMAAISERCF